nr:tryptophan-rich sensory protein [Dactylosporangium thailandense]
MHVPTWLRTTAAVTAAAGIGSLVTRPGDPWYRRLEKPSWQPPRQAFPLVWTPLYGLIAFAGARALDARRGPGQRSFAAAYGANLALNAAWTAIFFGARRPRAALAEIALLNASNLDLLRRAWQADRTAGAALVPYVAWTGFATALNAAIARRN